jgi:hypothetical protein
MPVKESEVRPPSARLEGGGGGGRWKNNNSQLKNGYTSPLRRERKDNNTIHMQNKEFECMYISIYLPINLLSLAT